MNQRIIVFLDIDGVLLPFPHHPSLPIAEGRIFPNETLSALSLILEAFPSTTMKSASFINQNESSGIGIDIVLSSTWRVQKSIHHEIISEFHSYGCGPLGTLNDFYDITDPAFHGVRQHEIYRWLQTHPSEMIAAWIALDDEDLLHGAENAEFKTHFEGHVIHCDSAVGLTRDQAMEGISLLQKQLDVESLR
jgi:hypothetical protein